MPTSKKCRLTRHGNAPKASQDRDRLLSELGMEQARQLGKTWQSEGFSPTWIACSTTHRAVLTAFLAYNELTHGMRGYDLHLMPELYLGCDLQRAGIIDMACEKIGNAPLRAYLDSMAREAILGYGEAAAEALLRAQSAGGSILAHKEVAIIGHAVLIQSIAFALSNSPFFVADAETGRRIMDETLDECGVISLDERT